MAKAGRRRRRHRSAVGRVHRCPGVCRFAVLGPAAGRHPSLRHGRMETCWRRASAFRSWGRRRHRWESIATCTSSMQGRPGGSPPPRRWRRSSARKSSIADPGGRPPDQKHCGDRHGLALRSDAFSSVPVVVAVTGAILLPSWTFSTIWGPWWYPCSSCTRLQDHLAEPQAAHRRGCARRGSPTDSGHRLRHQRRSAGSRHPHALHRHEHPGRPARHRRRRPHRPRRP